MYIHGYQIHNVLNVYRKQLSHGPGANGSKGSTTADTKDRITISEKGQRQSIMDKISSEIVERITQAGPGNEFEAIVAGQLSTKPKKEQEIPSNGHTSFKYTAIDEQNRKSTNTLTIQGFSPQNKKSESLVDHHIGKNPVSEMG
jgi:hypothetical protein